MLVKTILNRIEKHKRFVYDEVIMNEEKGRIEVSIRPRSNSRARCSNCSAPAPLYDHLDTRAFQYVPLWGIAVVLLYTMRRVKCHQCGVRVEAVPWCIGKTPISRSFSLFLASWAKRLSWQEVAQCFSVNWRQVFSAVEFVVDKFFVLFDSIEYSFYQHPVLSFLLVCSELQKRVQDAI